MIEKVERPELLCGAIVYQAILDWQALTRGRRVPGESFASLRAFFRSEWCALLLENTPYHPERLLAALERRRLRGDGAIMTRRHVTGKRNA